MAKIMVTGGAGFIAFHLIQSLVKRGHQVTAFDNFNDYYEVELKEARVAKLTEVGVDVKYVDLRNADEVIEFVRTNTPDVVMHLGAYAGVRHSLDNPQLYIDNNITGTQNLITACNEAGVEKVVYASTSCTMAGNPLPWNEDEKTGYQLNPYGYSKSTNECQMMSSSIATTIGLRFFTVYGPWGRPDMALFDFTRKIIAGEPITLFNYGDMVRDFTYVDDIVQGINIVIDRALESQDIDEIYNIGYGEQVQLLDFVDNIEKQLDREAIHKLVPMHPADTHQTWSDCSKLKALGYQPTTPISVGVANFVEWYKGYYNVN